MFTKQIAFYFCCWVIGIQTLSGAPIVTSVSPSNGAVAGGNVVTISGSGFTGATNVNFGFRPAAAFVVVNDSTISATVPAGTAGHVDVAVTALAITSPLTPDDFYTYTEIGWQGVTAGITPNQVAIFNTSTNSFTAQIPLPAFAITTTINPAGTFIYSGDSVPPGVTIIDVATNTIVGNIPTSVGPGAFDIIVNPAGTRAYLSNNTSGFLTVIDLTTNTVITDIFVAANLGNVAITPDGSKIFVGDFSTGLLYVVDTASNTVVNAIPVGNFPGKASITPDGTKVFVSIFFSDAVRVIDIATEVVTNSINVPAGSHPYGSTILPNMQKLYVLNFQSSTVSIVDIATETVIGPPIPLAAGSRPFWAVSTPDSLAAYFIDETTDRVTPIDATTNIVGTPFGGEGGTLQDIAMSADQAPVAAFFAISQPVGAPTTFDASASISPVGTIVSYTWDFGDGTIVTTASPLINHTYSTVGAYNVTLRVTNSAGTSTEKVFSSGFMSKNGGPSAVRSRIIQVIPNPPTGLSGFQKRCKYPSQTDIVNVLSWDPPAIGPPATYEIFRDPLLTDLIATVPGNQLTFSDHNRKKRKSYTYYVVSVSSLGVRSAPVSMTILPK